jgi:peptide/nickel transport system permease protein
MPFIPVILWTDALLFLLVGALALFAWQVRRHEHLRQPWRKVAQSRVGMSAAVLLTLFVVLGLLDSLHYRPRLADTGASGAE